MDYNDKLRLAKEALDSGFYDKNTIEYIFPELAESEDERIRKDIIHLVQKSHEQGGYALHKYEADEMLTWLEKQGKPKISPVFDIEIPFGAKDSELQEATYYIPKGFYAEIDDDKVVIKKGEQKPTWSEEDEKKRNLLINILKVNHPNGYFKVNPINTLNMEAMHVEELVDWLKALKDRYTWKPSDEQMCALEYIINNARNTSYSCKIAKELLEQLKKLK